MRFDDITLDLGVNEVNYNSSYLVQNANLAYIVYSNMYIYPIVNKNIKLVVTMAIHVVLHTLSNGNYGGQITKTMCS